MSTWKAADLQQHAANSTVRCVGPQNEFAGWVHHVQALRAQEPGLDLAKTALMLVSPAEGDATLGQVVQWGRKMLEALDMIGVKIDEPKEGKQLRLA